MTRSVVALAGAGIAIVLLIFAIESGKPERSAPDGNAEVAVLGKEEKAKRYEPAKEISTPDGFINTPPITIREFVGKEVVLVDFWTYSCINCQRTIPHLDAWYEKYKNQGLVIIGVHTPEFGFEQDYENVAAAVKKFDIKYPVVLDNDYSTWTSYKNRYWPRKYLVDIDGFIVYDHIGEGGYEETERKIRETLEERKQILDLRQEIPEGLSETETIATDAGSPEVYFGANRNELFGNGPAGKVVTATFLLPEKKELNTLYLDGIWSVTSEFAENSSAESKIVFRYQAKNVYFVAGSEMPVSLRVFLDGKPIRSADAGSDAAENSSITVSDHRLYHVVGTQIPGEHTLELRVQEPGLKAFTFTFG